MELILLAFLGSHFLSPILEMFNSLHVLGTNREHLTMCPFSTPIKHCNSARKLNKVLASKGPTVHNPWNMERAIAGENSSANDCFWENGVNIPRRRFKVHSLTLAPPVLPDPRPQASPWIADHEGGWGKGTLWTFPAQC